MYLLVCGKLGKCGKCGIWERRSAVSGQRFGDALERPEGPFLRSAADPTATAAAPTLRPAQEVTARAFGTRASSLSHQGLFPFAPGPPMALLALHNLVQTFEPGITQQQNNANNVVIIAVFFVFCTLEAVFVRIFIAEHNIFPSHR
ncbi:hypothetical protein GE061_007620 [Apolygus lucorum]|uniref:Uncharacterized protein n=1 Tax=Apolygus lucorum TaxID=248454 RepID=A0A8S9WTQ1_APOLU|nr:hypothetical protein GE061_007620 [Apolygus lucorum]